MTNDDKPAFSIRVEPGDAEDPATQIHKNVQLFKDTFSDQVLLNMMTAKLIKVKYDTLVKEGFTPEQALFLCK